MHPTLFNLFGSFEIKSYGMLLMLGFLSAVWLTMRRAERVKADPDRMLDLSFIMLIAGVMGSRLFYVAHYWRPQFSDAPNRFLAIIDIREGGLEFLGGFLGALVAMVIYCHFKRQSLRLMLDLLAPSAMWGLAFGRIGCFLNGCCFGGPALDPAANKPAYAWAVQFPFASPAQWRQWEDRKVTIPAELINTSREALQPSPVPEKALSMPVEKRESLRRELNLLKEQFEKSHAQDSKNAETRRLKGQFDAMQKELSSGYPELVMLGRAQQFPSRAEPSRHTSISELEALAQHSRSLPVHPAQLYAAFGAFLLSGFLSALFYRRKRHGVVIAALLMLYPIQRFFEEIIRVDNPQDMGGLTVSQMISLLLFLIGAAAMYAIFKMLPPRSPLAVNAAPSELPAAQPVPA